MLRRLPLNLRPRDRGVDQFSEPREIAEALPAVQQTREGESAAIAGKNNEMKVKDYYTQGRRGRVRRAVRSTW